MEQLSQSWQCLTVTLLLMFLLLHHDQSEAADAANPNDLKKTVKKDQAPPPLPPAQETAQLQPLAIGSAPENVLVISENPRKASSAVRQNGHSVSILPQEDVHIEPSSINNNEDFPDTYAAVFYVLVGITSTALFLLVVRIYRLRLSRAERKYGVQGDRANQELTPLPMAIEDVNSDEEEDHTLFEVNRQSIRIL